MKQVMRKIYDNNSILNEYLSAISERKDVACFGLNKPSRASVIYYTFIKREQTVLVVTKDSKEAIDLVDDLKSFTSDVMYFPAKEIVFFDSYAHSNEIVNQRLKVLKALKHRDKKIIITPIHNLFIKLLSKKQWENNYILIDKETTIDLQDLSKQLIHLGYERSSMIDSKGHFSIRGGIIDIFPRSSRVPYRMELFGDEIDSIRTFDLDTQRTITKVDAVEIDPAREIILDEICEKKFIETLKKSIDSKHLIEKKKEQLREYIEKMKEEIFIDGLDSYFPILYQTYDTILEYIENPIVMLETPNRLSQAGEFFVEDIEKRFENYFENGEALKGQFERIISMTDLEERLLAHHKIILDDLKKDIHNFTYKQSFHFKTSLPSKYFKKIDELAIDLKNWQKKKYRVIILLSSAEKISQIKEKLNTFDLFPKTNAKQLIGGEIVLVENILKQGFIFDSSRLVVLSENELFGVKKYKKRKISKDKSKIIKTYDELSVGDLVVHEEHGIGEFKGVTKLNIENNQNDYLKIQYAGTDILYIPVNQMDLIQKYIGKRKKKKRLSSLNSDKWKRKKARVKSAIEDMTDELIELYSKRINREGFAFDEDSEWQREFEARFPYNETSDQIKSIREIKEDMESSIPMERLLCGDVGYGKTEVALRAMFKAVDNNKQVAFLVPTTILAQQHFSTIKKRFENYPVSIEMMSRFKTKKEQKQIAKNLKAGLVDVVVGTHRILSKDIQFSDLGLLVVDEEQRFGVKDKEKIKFLKENLDILSLTATPIPRTLHMSLIGIRDMSVLEEPPENRYPIQTYVTTFDQSLIKEAILREVGRNGQVYFVHNRVKDIEEFTFQIQQLVPGVRVHFAHGQMSSRKLEKIMLAFLNKEFDVLISTTIIETGLDIPEVNTILINDADHFGLSQLYQLRGRVGRSNKIAYAYLLYKKDKVLSEVAEKRLKAIKNFTDLGAGFKIAMRDLEIRGAGNLLGLKQHGHMETIGYELYCKLLEESVSKAKGEMVQTKVEADIQMQINAYIPDSYIKNSKLKLEMYKKVSSIQSTDELFEVQDEFIDRFGDLPKEVLYLTQIALIKSFVEKMGISKVVDRGTKVGFEFYNEESIDLDLVNLMIEHYKRKIRFINAKEPYFEYRFLDNKLSKSQKLQEIYSFVKKVYKMNQ